MEREPTTQAYVERRTREGLTKRRIRRVLKRYIARQIHRNLAATDLAPQAPLVAWQHIEASPRDDPLPETPMRRFTSAASSARLI